ncbi:hypothetical protein [Allorhodopirellula solitaria]|uniref:Uncharacterized protein n=1 Tax=Allorhodopirellula solitaria TaxID=2527987 RepID=A0A5C5X1X3_9BACT|nr:hypothetical protein [Allorhodopirellula solitaria]TWT56609.1 hypothetical protein CA85_41430 [Allorhodopirellula solitaria]
MSLGSTDVPPLLRLDDRTTILPIIHGSGQFAWLTRRFLLEHRFDCVAVSLPESFRECVEQAVLELPKPSIVIQQPTPNYESTYDAAQDFRGSYDAEASDEFSQSFGAEDDEDSPDEIPTSYVPIDPCQGVIMAIRAAMGEHIRREFIDLETNRFQPYSTVMPDPFAVRHVHCEKFAAAVLPSIPRPSDDQTRERMAYMAARLVELAKSHQQILLVTSVLDWPWIREAHRLLKEGRGRELQTFEHDHVQTPETFAVDPKTLLFLFGELPFITGLYERARAQLEEDEDLQVDGVKELLIAAKESYLAEFGNRARRITPLLLSKCLQYIRNLSLLHRRMTPDMVTIVTACQQILGDQFALHVAEIATEYRVLPTPTSEHAAGSSSHGGPETDSSDIPFGEQLTDAALSDGSDEPFEEDTQRTGESHAENTPEFLDDAALTQVKLGIDQGRLPDGEIVSLVNRLPGPPLTWQTLSLQPRPSKDERNRWEYNWNPYSQCSFPPEDERIEMLRNRVCERAQAIMGQDLARTEKFTTSVKDGIDIRDTLRHWYEKEIYVRVIPPSRGKLDACLMLFDSPADPRDYPWRTTWFAEHDWESTLAFFASDFTKEMVGPGIGMGTYGGAMFLYPPTPIRDIWTDRRLDFTETLEERLIAAACMHSRCRQIALMSGLPPGAGWRRLARRFKKQLVHVPLTSFSDQEVQQLRMVHVLNGSDVRSYAADFIRKA